MSILEVSHLKKVYTTRFGGQKVEALSDVSFSVEEGEFVAIMGESGSGKTTLLNILAALDRPTAGSVTLSGKDLASVREKDMAAFRRESGLCVPGFQPAGHLFPAGQHFPAPGALGQEVSGDGATAGAPSGYPGNHRAAGQIPL